MVALLYQMGYSSMSDSLYESKKIDKFIHNYSVVCHIDKGKILASIIITSYI